MTDYYAEYEREGLFDNTTSLIELGATNSYSGKGGYKMVKK